MELSANSKNIIATLRLDTIEKSGVDIPHISMLKLISRFPKVAYNSHIIRKKDR